jgi:hypothetical protein
VRRRSGDLLAALSSGLCRMLDMDFREHAFQDVRE